MEERKVIIMAKEFFKNLPDTSTPLNASRLNGLLNGSESMGNIVVGDVKCKNLLNINATPLTMWNSTPTINGDTLTTSGEDVRFVAYSIDVTPNTNYTLSLNSLNGKIAIYDILIETNIGETTSTQLTFNSGSHEQLAVLFYGSGTYVKPQIEEGTTATEYTQYKGIGYTSGSNENGSWIKYDDGTMIQWGIIEKTGTIGIYSNVSKWYYDDGYVIHLPQNFINNLYYANVTIQSFALITMQVYSITDYATETFKFNLSSNIEYTFENFEFRWFAIGRWK